MQNTFSDILRLALIAGLSDRKRFVNKLTAIIEDFQHDPEKAGWWARILEDYLVNMKDNMNREHVFKNAVSSARLPDKEQIEDLTKAIENLTNELKQKK